MKLYKSEEWPGWWIGEDAEGALMRWPAKKGGWLKRTPYTSGKRQLDVVDARLARGTGWFGGGSGRPPRHTSPAKTFGIRATVDEINAWTREAKEDGEERPTVWARDQLNEVVKRRRGSKP